MNNKLLSKESLEMIYSALLTKFKSLIGKPDWSQNDNTSKDYIKNRPFYTTKTGEVKKLDKKYIPDLGLSWKDIAHDTNNFILEETSFTFPEQLILDDVLPRTVVLEEGKTYTVTFDGKSYECVARKDELDDIYIGNQSLAYDVGEWEFPETIESDEPFFITTYEPDWWNAVIVSEEGTHTLSISYESYDKIDEKYLSNADWNTLQNKPFYSEFVDGYIMHEQSFTVLREDSQGKYVMNLSRDIRLNNVLELDSKYIVVYDGVEYTATLYEDEGGYYFGMNFYYPDNPESLPFGFWFNNRDTLTILCASTSGKHSFAIKGIEEVVTPINEKYLPSGIRDLSYKLKETKEDLNQKIDKKKTEVQEELATAMQEVDTAKMNKANPEGTGTFSVNRTQESTVGYCSSAVGNEVIANGRSSFVCGEFNKDKVSIYNKKYVPVGSPKIKFQRDMIFYYSKEYVYDEETGIYTLINPSSIEAYDLRNSTPSALADCYFVGTAFGSLSSNVVEGSVLYRILYNRKTTNKTYSTHFGLYDDDNFYMSYVEYEYTTKVERNSERTEYAYMVGNGTDDNNRSNAHTLDWDGNAEYQGDVKAMACGGESPISLVETWNKVNSLGEPSAVNWKTFKDSWGTYTYAFNEKILNYEIAQTITNTSGNGSISALEDIVSLTYYLHNSWWSDVEVSTAKGVVDNYKALKDGNAFISGKSLEIYYQEPLNKLIQNCMVITESSLHGATHVIKTVGGDVGSCIYYNSDNNAVTHWESSYTGVTTDFTLSGKSADAKAVGDALNTKINTPESSSVGQVLTVKEVDSDGRPIKWECVNIETNTSIILKSSTEGSTKQFRLTINDSGALTTSEIIE